MVTAITAARAGEIAVQEERARIAQHLHDTAGQILFTISLSAQDLRERAAADALDAGAVAEGVKRIEYEAAQASAVLRQTMHSLLPAGEALPVTLRRDVATFSRRSGIPAEAIVLGTPVETTDLIDDTIVTVVREGLHNVERHAGASTVSVTLTYRPLDMAVLIQDDGRGLSRVPTITPLPGKARGLGIPGLQQRVRAAGGELDLHNGEDGGTVLLVSLPLGSAA
jgi:signal transduction histidine kinase